MLTPRRAGAPRHRRNWHSSPQRRVAGIFPPRGWRSSMWRWETGTKPFPGFKKAAKIGPSTCCTSRWNPWQTPCEPIPGLTLWCTAFLLPGRVRI